LRTRYVCPLLSMFQLFYIRASPPRGETAVRKPAKRSCAAAGARLRGGSTGCKPLSSDGGGGTFWKVRPPLRSEAGVVEPRRRAHNRIFSILISIHRHPGVDITRISHFHSNRTRAFFLVYSILLGFLRSCVLTFFFCLVRASDTLFYFFHSRKWRARLVRISIIYLFLYKT
jgi:hypothetical protein